MLRARVWLLLLLGVSFLASVCVSFGVTQQEQQCLQICESEKDPYQLQICKNRCKVGEEREREEERGHDDRGRRQRGRQEGEKEEEKRDERVHPRPHPPHQHEHDQEEEHVWPHQEDERQRGKESEANEKREEELWRGRHRWEDPEERERVRQRVEERIKREMEERMKREEEEKRHRREKREQREEREERQDSQTHKKNPFYFSSKMFTTLYKNQYGHIRVLHSFHKRSPKLKNLVNYRIVEFQSKPNTLLLPGHADIDSIIIILSGRALVTFFNPNNRETYSLEPGYAQRIPPGTTFTVANLDKNNDLKLIKLAIPVNEPGNYENFFLSSTQDQQSYLQGFSQNILQASFNTDYDEIKRVLFGEEGQHKGEQRKQEGVIVQLSKEQIQELSKPANRKIISVEYEPFYLRSPYPVYSNNFGKFFEVIPENNPHLKDLDIYLDSVDMNEGALLLPHFNSKAIVILAVNEGKANIELVGLKEQHEQQEEQETREVQRYEAEVSEDEIFVIPSAYPVVVNATSNLSFFAFGINAENNQRNFLAGEKGNLIREMHRPVKDLAFPGSAGDVQKLMKNQQDSYFVDAQPQPQQKEEGRKGSPLSSILGALY